MPLGFIGTVTVGKRIGLNQLALTILIGIALSFAVEVVQYYDTGRDTEATDLYANTLGTAIGAGIGWFFGQDFRFPLLREISANRVPALLLTAWLGYRLYPYVPTIDLHKYWGALKPVFLYPQLTPDSLFRHVAIWLSICVMIEKIAGDHRASGLIRRFAVFLIFSCVLVISTRVTLAQIAGIVVAFANLAHIADMAGAGGDRPPRRWASMSSFSALNRLYSRSRRALTAGCRSSALCRARSTSMCSHSSRSLPPMADIIT